MLAGRRRPPTRRTTPSHRPSWLRAARGGGFTIPKLRLPSATSRRKSPSPARERTPPPAPPRAGGSPSPARVRTPQPASDPRLRGRRERGFAGASSSARLFNARRVGRAAAFSAFSDAPSDAPFGRDGFDSFRGGFPRRPSSTRPGEDPYVRERVRASPREDRVSGFPVPKSPRGSPRFDRGPFRRGGGFFARGGPDVGPHEDRLSSKRRRPSSPAPPGRTVVIDAWGREFVVSSPRFTAPVSARTSARSGGRGETWVDARRRRGASTTRAERPSSRRVRERERRRDSARVDARGRRGEEDRDREEEDGPEAVLGAVRSMRSGVRGGVPPRRRGEAADVPPVLRRARPAARGQGRGPPPRGFRGGSFPGGGRFRAEGPPRVVSAAPAPREGSPGPGPRPAAVAGSGGTYASSGRVLRLRVSRRLRRRLRERRPPPSGTRPALARRGVRVPSRLGRVPRVSPRGVPSGGGLGLGLGLGRRVRFVVPRLVVPPPFVSRAGSRALPRRAGDFAGDVRPSRGSGPGCPGAGSRFRRRRAREGDDDAGWRRRRRREEAFETRFVGRTFRRRRRRRLGRSRGTTSTNDRRARSCETGG